MLKTKQKVILFDGPDGCGKTNMGQELSRRLDIPYFKNKKESMFFENDPSYFANALKYGDSYFCDYLKQSGASIILDRSFPSEWVYSKAFNRKTDDKMLKLIDSLYSDLGLIILSPYRSSYNHVVDAFASIDSKKLEEIHNLYIDFSKWTTCRMHRFCVDDENIEKQMEFILGVI